MISATLFSSVAWAADVAPDAAQGAAGSSMLTSMLPFILIFAVMYILMIRPQQKRQKAHQTMLNEIKKGDKIQTSGGVFGTVTGDDKERNELTIEIAPQVRIKVGRGFVARVIRAGDGIASAKQ